MQKVFGAVFDCFYRQLCVIQNLYAENFYNKNYIEEKFNYFCLYFFLKLYIAI